MPTKATNKPTEDVVQEVFEHANCEGAKSAKSEGNDAGQPDFEIAVN